MRVLATSEPTILHFHEMSRMGAGVPAAQIVRPNRRYGRRACLVC